jgi:hypothetical protein
MSSGNTEAAQLLRAMRSFLGENDDEAYLDNFIDFPMQKADTAS